MCNLYTTLDGADIVQYFRRDSPQWDFKPTVGPLGTAPFITAERAQAGQWGMIPPASHTRTPMLSNGRRMSTNNARRETMATAATYRGAWRAGQRCLIPAWTYDEPYWGTGKNIWWRFARAGGTPWALAGLWSEWKDFTTGEIVPNFTMITQNCDTHPLLKLMHKPDPKLPADQQDKRAVVPIEPADWETWLKGSVEEAEALIRVPGMEVFRHGAADPAKLVSLSVQQD
ncbi:SOS response-associated peptidase [Hydrogenophaga sp.]|uniref:SOS response-associated peptidase n=1 Tax=Hydrogenophaga sp. TaxID=1904254 RepID=UPI003F719699